MKAPEKEDFTWRFRLDDCSMERVYDNPFVEMIRVQVEHLLNVVRFTAGGEQVSIDGFEMLNEPGVNHRLFPRRQPNDEQTTRGRDRRQEHA